MLVLEVSEFLRFEVRMWIPDMHLWTSSPRHVQFGKVILVSD